MPMANHRRPWRNLVLLLTGLIAMHVVDGGAIGMNWGRKTSHRLLPSMVVDIMLQNNIKYLKIFSPEVKAMTPFAGTNIAVTLTIPTSSIPFVKIPSVARYLLNDHIRRFINMGVNVRCLHLGTDVMKNITIYEQAVDSLRVMNSIITANEMDFLETSIVHSLAALNPITKPSKADFNPLYKMKIEEFLSIAKDKKNSTFSISFMPIDFMLTYNLPLEFAFMDNKSNFTIEDNGHIYTNAFELVYDSFVSALTKAGAPDMDIVVSQIGWPTDGHPMATVGNAERFFRGFLPYIKSDKGTPLRPGASIEIYIINLADENTGNVADGKFYMRHWGIYKSNGQSKFKIDLSGEGRDIYPTVARGTVSMPKRWCVFNGDKSNLTKVEEQFNLACAKGDCTPLYPGGSCSRLNFDHNVSYAFNNYFQMSSQYSSEGMSCNFDGLGVVVPDDPSVGNCDFLVEILGADLRDVGGVAMAAASRVHTTSTSMAVVLAFTCFALLQLHR